MTGVAPDALMVPEKPRAKVPLVLRLLARRWWSAIAFVGLALLGNVLVVFLAQGPANWLPTIEGQISEVVLLARTYPVPASTVGLVVLAVTALGYLEQRRITALDRQAAVQLAQDVAAMKRQVSTSTLEYVYQLVEQLDPDAFVPRYVAAVYLRRTDALSGADADVLAREALQQAASRPSPGALAGSGPLGICVFGRPTEGKTRLAWEALRATLPTYLFVKWPYARPQYPLDFAALHGRDVVLWLDDLQKYSADEALRLADLPRQFAAEQVRLVVVATCRDGADETSVRERLGAFLARLTLVRLRDLTPQEATQLTQELAAVGIAARVDESDLTPGSLLLGVERMRDEQYPALPEPAKRVLRALKLLDSAGIYDSPAPRTRAVAVGVFGLEERTWREACSALAAASFVRLGAADADGERPVQMLADVYLERAVPDYPDPHVPGAAPADDWPPLQQVLERTRDAAALHSLGLAYYERPLGDLRANQQRAVACYLAVLQALTREMQPANWAAAQNNLGVSLGAQAQLAEGAERARLLAAAVEAFQQALTVRTREALPADWAATQNNLGPTLYDQAQLAEGAERARLLAADVAAYQNALQVYTREALPTGWAMTQNNLGVALLAQAALAQGDERARLLAAAVEAFQHALQVYTRETLPVYWAGTQSNLGGILFAQAALAEGDERARLLAGVVEAFQNALQVFTVDSQPYFHQIVAKNLHLAELALAEPTSLIDG